MSKNIFFSSEAREKVLRSKQLSHPVQASLEKIQAATISAHNDISPASGNDVSA